MSSPLARRIAALERRHPEDKPLRLMTMRELDAHISAKLERVTDEELEELLACAKSGDEARALSEAIRAGRLDSEAVELLFQAWAEAVRRGVGEDDERVSGDELRGLVSAAG